MTAVLTQPIADMNAALKVSEFSLVDLDGEVLGRLRFPPGIARSAVREFISYYWEQLAVVQQNCVGNATQTTGWSTLLFLGTVELYKTLLAESGGICRSSNLLVVRKQSAKLMQQIAETVSEVAVDEASPSPMQITKEPEQSDDLAIEPEPQCLESEQIPQSEPQPEMATVEQLLPLSLKQLRSLAITHNIPGYNTLTKSRQKAELELIPQLVGMVTTAELP
ncbi:MAG TPA: hypothetical protein V6D15_16095 [Oculatellaceae cyanobacterium]